MRRSILSRGKSLFLLLFLFTADSPPPPRTLIPTNPQQRSHQHTPFHYKNRKREKKIKRERGMFTFWMWDWSSETNPCITWEFLTNASEFLSTVSGRTDRCKALVRMEFAFRTEAAVLLTKAPSISTPLFYPTPLFSHSLVRLASLLSPCMLPLLACV